MGSKLTALIESEKADAEVKLSKAKQDNDDAQAALEAAQAAQKEAEAKAVAATAKAAKAVKDKEKAELNKMKNEHTIQDEKFKVSKLMKDFEEYKQQVEDERAAASQSSDGFFG